MMDDDTVYVEIECSQVFYYRTLKGIPKAEYDEYKRIGSTPLNTPALTYQDVLDFQFKFAERHVDPVKDILSRSGFGDVSVTKTLRKDGSEQ